MSDVANRIVQKLWSYCNVLRDDGLSYQDYLEQLTFLLFLKMADERAALTGEPQAIPTSFRWVDLANPKMEGVKLEQQYRDTLRKLGEQGGMLGLIFSKAQNKIQDPAKLRKLVRRHLQPRLIANQVDDELAELSGVLNFILGLAEDKPKHPALLTDLPQRVAIVLA